MSDQRRRFKRSASTKTFLRLLGITILCLPLFALSPLKEKAIRGPAKIGAGTFAPLYGLDTGQRELPLAEFMIDRFPVTNRQFSDFVNSHPEWLPLNTPALLADSGYLSHWNHEQNKCSPKKQDLDSPVVHLSWFAAQAYCESVKGRLPTGLEWEYVAAASEKVRDASRDADFVAQILAWYSHPVESSIGEIGQKPPNYWGVYDLHGLIWEWTEDFNSMFVAGDNRREDDRLKNLFCGDGATGAARREDYAAFMRYALRNSLKANFTLANLGFRCAYDPNKEPKS